MMVDHAPRLLENSGASPWWLRFDGLWRPQTTHCLGSYVHITWYYRTPSQVLATEIRFVQKDPGKINGKAVKVCMTVIIKHCNIWQCRSSSQDCWLTQMRFQSVPVFFEPWTRDVHDQSYVKIKRSGALKLKFWRLTLGWNDGRSKSFDVGDGSVYSRGSINPYYWISYAK